MTSWPRSRGDGGVSPCSAANTSGPVQTRCAIVAVTEIGDYVQLDVAAPDIAPRFRPGQFIAVAVGGPESSLLLRRAFAVYDAEDGVVRFVVAEHGPGTRWLVSRRPGEVLDVVGPLGTAFPLTADGAAVLVGGGYGSAPLVALGRRLAAARTTFASVVGAATASRLCAVADLHSIGPVTVTTEDGSVGTRGRVTDVLPAVASGLPAPIVYACGPMAMLRAVGEVASAHGLGAFVAVEEAMACGIGVCMTCVLPVRGSDSVSRFVRSCVDGPVFRAEQVDWDDVGRLPADLVGADAMGRSWPI
jgi:dihydroorotate dehydrogenase electron transfer subunit